MSAAGRREELEALIWRRCVVDPPDVDLILAAADLYAFTMASEELQRYAGTAADNRLAEQLASRIQGRHRLAEASAEYYRRTS